MSVCNWNVGGFICVGLYFSSGQATPFSFEYGSYSLFIVGVVMGHSSLWHLPANQRPHLVCLAKAQSSAVGFPLSDLSPSETERQPESVRSHCSWVIQRLLSSSSGSLRSKIHSSHWQSISVTFAFSLLLTLLVRTTTSSVVMNPLQASWFWESSLWSERRESASNLQTQLWCLFVLF